MSARVIPVTANAQVGHHYILYYLQPWAFIRMPNIIILVCVATPLGLSGPDTIRNGLRRASIQKKKSVIVAVLASKINKYIYIYLH